MNKMNKTTKNNELHISKFRMYLKFGKIIMNGIFKGKWVLEGVEEITVDQVNEHLKSDNPPILIDVRDRGEFYGTSKSGKKYGHIPNAKSFPIMQLAPNINKLEEYKDREIVTMCPGGGMSLVAAELMEKAGFKDSKSMRGGLDAWHKNGYDLTTEFDTEFPLKNEDTQVLEENFSDERYGGDVNHTVDARNFSCPVPIMNSKKAIMKLKTGQILEILTTDPGSKSDIPAWAKVTGKELVSMEDVGPKEFRFIVRKQK